MEVGSSVYIFPAEAEVAESLAMTHKGSEKENSSCCSYWDRIVFTAVINRLTQHTEYFRKVKTRIVCFKNAYCSFFADICCSLLRFELC